MCCGALQQELTLLMHLSEYHDCCTRYAMREALAIVAEDGLQATWKRHRDMHNMLWDGLGKLGLTPLVRAPSHRLASVNAIEVRHCLNRARKLEENSLCACACACARTSFACARNTQLFRCSGCLEQVLLSKCHILPATSCRRQKPGYAVIT